MKTYATFLGFALPFVAQAALSDADVASVFPDSRNNLSTLTSAAVRFRQYAASFVANSSHILSSSSKLFLISGPELRTVTLNKTDATWDLVGWMGHGIGTGMSNGICLPFGQTPTTPGRFHITNQPNMSFRPQSLLPLVCTVLSMRSQPIQLLGLLGPPFPSFAPLSFANVASYGTTSSQGTIERATGQVLLYSYGTASVELSKSYIPASTGNDSGGGSDGSGGSGIGRSNQPQEATSAGWTRHSKLIAAHAAFGGVAFMIISPAAILFGRYFRSQKWLPAHRALQIVTVSFMLIAFALAGTATGNNPKHTHHKIGYAMFVITLLQGMSSSLTHVIVGIGLGYSQVRTGMQEWEDEASSGMSSPDGVRIVYYTLWMWRLLLISSASSSLPPRTFLGRALKTVQQKQEMENKA
ncbi:hypothetical protein BT69DRAFT_1328015 [Atractiella rhizophila]|nr:hypothetical protein BT69DRAFT_1328015 [Atractiella rhizophila]